MRTLPVFSEQGLQVCQIVVKMVILRIAFLCENLCCFNFLCFVQRTCFPSPSRIQTPDVFGLERWAFLMVTLSVKMIMIITMVTMVTLIVVLQRWL